MSKTPLPTRARALGWLLLGMLGACSAASVVRDFAAPAVRKYLLGVASQNYNADYTEDLDKLIGQIMHPSTPGLSPEPAPGLGTPQAPPAQPPSASPVPPVAPPEPAVAQPQPAQPAYPPPAAPAAAPSGPPIDLEVALLKEVVADGRSYPVAVADGDVLKDGVGRAAAGDNLKVTFRVNRDCYVYVVSVDATAWAQPVFPSSASGFSNPVQAGRTYEVPPGESWFYLDGYRGVETFYFLASPAPRPDLESLLDGLAGRTRDLGGAAVAAAAVEQPAEITRGLAGVRPGAGTSVTGSNGQVYEGVPTQSFLATAGGDVVITRWFRHE